MNTTNSVNSLRGRLLGVDHGTKRIGLAICDALWIAARPLQILKRKSRAEDFAYINAIITQQQISSIVVGLPEQPADSINPGTAQADQVRHWAMRLAAAVPVPVYLWPEQFSTFEAERLAAEAGAKRAEQIDDRAAAVILQSFIDAHREGETLPEPVRIKSTDRSQGNPL